MLTLHLAAAPLAHATICEGPDLHDLSVRPDGTLHVSGIHDHAAESRDGGQHWVDIPADPARAWSESAHPFWPASLHSPDGVRYQNLLVNGDIDVVIRSRDGGATWEQAPLGPRAVLLQDDAQGAWWIFHSDLRVQRRGASSVGAFWLRGAPRDTGRLEDSPSGTSIEFDGHRLVTHDTMHRSNDVPLPPPFAWPDDAWVQVTGFAVDLRGTIWLSTRRHLVRGLDGGARWELVSVQPAGAWMKCNGDPLHGSPPPPPTRAEVVR